MLPTAAALAKSNVNGRELSKTPSSTLVSLAAELGGDVALVGRLVWNDRDPGWATQWQIDRPGRAHRWQLRGVTFDEAFLRRYGGFEALASGARAAGRRAAGARSQPAGPVALQGDSLIDPRGGMVKI